MASIQCGQPTLLHLPKKNSSKNASLTDTVISKSLKVEKSALKDQGMLVWKVNKVSKVKQSKGRCM
jgi:hypothetical protein